MDVLTDLLQRSRAHGAAFCRTTAYGEWGLRFPGRAVLSVHAVLEGEAHVWAQDPGAGQRMAPGDVISCARTSPTMSPTPPAPRPSRWRA